MLSSFLWIWSPTDDGMQEEEEEEEEETLYMYDVYIYIPTIYFVVGKC